MENIKNNYKINKNSGFKHVGKNPKGGHPKSGHKSYLNGDKMRSNDFNRDKMKISKVPTRLKYSADNDNKNSFNGQYNNKTNNKKVQNTGNVLRTSSSFGFSKNSHKGTFDNNKNFIKRKVTVKKFTTGFNKTDDINKGKNFNNDKNITKQSKNYTTSGNNITTKYGKANRLSYNKDRNYSSNASNVTGDRLKSKTKIVTTKTSNKNIKRTFKSKSNKDNPVFSKFDNKNSSLSMSGVLEGNANGYAFLRVEEGQDIFIPARSLNGALHGDTVLVRVSSYNGRTEGQVIKVIEHSIKMVVGKLAISPISCIVKPTDSKIAKEIIINRQDLSNAVDGDIVFVELKDDKKLSGKIVEVLGREGDIGLDVLSVIRSFGLKESFEYKTQEEASKLPKAIVQEQLQGRLDFRGQLIISIDGDDTKDIDDAVSVVNTGDGWRLGVHIADVAEYVPLGSALDKEAFVRGTSVYFADRVLPMLPRELSNGICSLNPLSSRLTLSLIMDIDANGNVVRHQLQEGVINALHLTYKNVSDILEGNLNVLLKIEGVDQHNMQAVCDMIIEMDKLRMVLNVRRRIGGSIDFELPESKIIIDGSGAAVDVIRQERDSSHMIIEEFMLIANQTIAKKFDNLNIPFIYRVHQKPDSKKIEILSEFAKAFGYNFRDNADDISPMDIRNLIESVEPRYSKAVNTMALRSMTKANYESSNDGHFGLGYKYYTHFTSPIRRYPDLAIHRIIKDYLHGDAAILKNYKEWVVDTSKQASKCERIAEEAERKVENLKKAEYMRGHIGEVYLGTISGVIDRGFFVELQNTVEGLVRVEHLKGKYVYDSKTLKLIGEQMTYSLGDSVEIIVYGVENDKIEFLLNDGTIDRIKTINKNTKHKNNRKQNAKHRYNRK